MTDIFISYSREDRPRVQVIAESLEKYGVKVWWDAHIKTGHGFRQEIQASLSDAAAVIVIWSQHSVGSRFVCDEADEGAARNILFPALIDLVDIPLGFRQIQTADLTHWRGKRDDRAYKEFLSAVVSFVGADAPAARAAPVPAIEEPVAEEPPPQKPASKPKAKKPPREKRPKPEKPEREGRYLVTGRGLRFALLWRSVFLTLLVGGAFGALAYNSDFIYPVFRPFFVAGISALVFISRFASFEADRMGGGAASLRLLSRSYIALFLFSLIASAPLLFEGRLYTEALRAVQIKGIDGADINGVNFDPSGTLLATASDDGTARVWGATTGVQKLVLTGHGNWVWSARFNPNSSEVVTASRDLTARVWDTHSGAVDLILKGHTASVLGAAFHPTEKLIATASADKTVRIWNSETGELVRTLTGASRVNAVAISADGRRMASADTAGIVRVWRWDGMSTEAVFTAPGETLLDVAFDASGRRVIAAGDNGRAFVWDVAAQKRVVVVDHGTKLFAARLIGDDELATGGIDGIVRLWRVSTGEKLSELTGHLDAIRSMAVSPDGKYLATGSRDNTARVWDLSIGKEIEIVGHVTPALTLPIPLVLDVPPVLVASHAPTSANLLQNLDKTGYLAGKGVALALAILIAGFVLAGLLFVVRARGLARWTVVAVLGGSVLYILAMALTDLPAEAASLWLIGGFVPAALFSLLLWLLRRLFARRGA